MMTDFLLNAVLKAKRKFWIKSGFIGTESHKGFTDPSDFFTGAFINYLQMVYENFVVLFGACMLLQLSVTSRARFTKMLFLSLGIG